MYPTIRKIPYRKTSAIVRLEKHIDDYIKSAPLNMEIKLAPDKFNTFLKEIPQAEQARYALQGIPYGSDGIYTLKVK